MKNTLLLSITILLSTSLLGQNIDYIDEYGKNYGQGVTFGNITWAPVNCGYHPELYPYGKLYQWGRKYGQGYGRPYNNATTCRNNIDRDPQNAQVVPGPTFAEEANSAENSKYFYTGHYGHAEWCLDNNSNMWNDGTANIPIKSQYDPCPSGWRVPTSAELNELLKLSSKWKRYQNQNGMLFSNEEGVNVFLPAAGERRASGKACCRSYAGEYWTSSISNFKEAPVYLSFVSEKIRLGADYRALGKSVRCVRETSTTNAEVPILEKNYKPLYKKLTAPQNPGEVFHNNVKLYTVSDGIRIALYDQNKNIIISPYRETLVETRGGYVTKDVGVISITYTGDKHMYFIVEYEDGLKEIYDEQGYRLHSKRNARITPYHHNGDTWFTSHHDDGCDLITRVGEISSNSTSRYLDYQYKNNRFYYLDNNKNWIDTQISLEYDDKSRPIQLKMNMPKELKYLFYDASLSLLRQLASQGYLDAIHHYCRQMLFHIYTSDVYSVDNYIAEDLIPLLEMAYPYHPNCQFYYACLLCGNFMILEDSARKAADASYKYINKEKAKYLFLKYFSNPDRPLVGSKTPWGCDDVELKEIANLAIPGLIK